MKQFELQFQIRGHVEYVLDEVVATLDCGYARHGNVQILTVWVETDNAIDAAFDTVARLSGLGIGVTKLYEDLVTRQDIADRTSVTRQTVGNWIRQDRRTDGISPFPNPYNIVGGGVWLWYEVNEWLHQIGRGDRLGYPTAMDYAKVNAAVQIAWVPPVE